MRDDRVDERFEAGLRDALRAELAGVRVGVGAAQVRGRIAARERSRRTTRLVLLAAALLAAAVALPAAGALLREISVTPPPGAAEPATVVAIEAASGDLVVSNAWPDGRLDEQWRLPGALERVREALDDPAATGLPADAVATVADDGSLAIGLPDGHVLWFAPRDGTTTLSGVFVSGEPGWVGWLDDGRLALVGRFVDLFDPLSGESWMARLPANVLPDWTRGSPQRLAMTGDGKVVAVQGDPATFQTTLGTLDLATDPATFTPGTPVSVQADTGLERRHGADGRYPGSWCQDGRLAMRCAGLGRQAEQSRAPAETWYAARADEALVDTVRTADGRGLLVVARSTATDRGRVIVAAAPGSWHQGFAFDAPAYDAASAEPVHLVGVAPDGQSAALLTPTGLVVGNLADGATSRLPAGTVFVGWPSEPDVATSGLATVSACDAATAGDAARVALSAAGITSPASAGAKPVVGDRGDADPYRRDEVAGSPPVIAEADGLLSLALPSGTCAEATIAEAVPVDGSPGGTSTELGAWLAGNGTIAGLLTIVAPPPGDWIVRVQLWLAGADREAILLYRVRVEAP